MSHLRVAALRKSYEGAEVVAGLDFELEAGVCFGLLGPNGAGKTTTLRLCLGLTSPDSGEISVLGLPVPARAREARRRIGVVSQVDNLDPDFTVRENLLVYGRYFGLASRELAARIPSLLEFAGLGAREGARIQTLSGGMKRRLTLARALINDPQLIFLDEPSTGLDPQARHLIWERLRRLTSEGRTILLTTHFMDEAERLCDRVAIIDHGRKIAEGAPRELILRHIEPQVVEVFGDGAQSWADRFAHAASDRCEKTGETIFCYIRNADALVHALERERGLRYLHRPANLEDVFLKLTGRELRDLHCPIRPLQNSMKALRLPLPSLRFVHVWRRNQLVWKKLAVPSMLGNLADPMLYMLGLGYGLGAMLPTVDGMPYIAFLAAGTVCSSTMMSASFEAMYSSFSRMHVQRTWDAIMNAPITLEDVMIGEAVWAASKAFMSGTAVLLVAAALGLVASPLALWVLPVIFLSGLAFAGLGLVMTSLSPSYDFFMYYFTLAITPMMLASGVFFPVGQLPAWLQATTHVLPLTHAIVLVRPLMNGSVPQSISVHVSVLVAYAAVSLCVALLLARRRLLK